MNVWTVEFSQAAIDDLARLEGSVRRRIIAKLKWVAEHFDEITPAPLHAEWREFYKLRIGDWRVVYAIQRSRRTVSIHYIDRRDKIYKL